MKRNLKALGLAMVAAFALSAVAASGAQAVIHHLTTAAPGIITAKDHVDTAFITGGGEVKCKEATYEGTVSDETNTEVTVNATYGGCTNETTGQSATVTMEHCAYVLTGNTDANGDAEVHLECAPESKVIIHTKIFFTECTITITPQTPKGGVSYTETTNPSSGKKDVTLNLTVKEIEYHIDPNNFPCNEFGNGKDGQLTGAVTAEGFKDLCGVGGGLTGTTRTTPGNHFNECQGLVQDLKLTTT